MDCSPVAGSKDSRSSPNVRTIIVSVLDAASRSLSAQGRGKGRSCVASWLRYLLALALFRRLLVTLLQVLASVRRASTTPRNFARQSFTMTRLVAAAWSSITLNCRMAARLLLRHRGAPADRLTPRMSIGALNAVSRKPQMPVSSSNATKLVQPVDISDRQVTDRKTHVFLRANATLPQCARRCRLCPRCRFAVVCRRGCEANAGDFMSGQFRVDY